MFATPKIFAALIVALLVAGAHGRAPKKIVGGSQASLGEFPYQVSLRSANGGHFCGGAIVSSRHIITAAHCVVNIKDPRSLTVATGTTSSLVGEIHSVKSIASHPYFDINNVRSPNDIAVITLADNISFNRNQNKLDLPTEPTPNGAHVTVSGWGYTNKSIRQITPRLGKAELKTISGSECQQRFGTTAVIYESQICTYVRRGLGTCQGDSGGPLAANGKLVGVVSWGVPCAEGLPDVFTNTFYHLDWIHQNMN